jgi:hypothetical protein
MATNSPSTALVAGILVASIPAAAGLILASSPNKDFVERELDRQEHHRKYVWRGRKRAHSVHTAPSIPDAVVSSSSPPSTVDAAVQNQENYPNDRSTTGHRTPSMVPVYSLQAAMDEEPSNHLNEWIILNSAEKKRSREKVDHSVGEEATSTGASATFSSSSSSSSEFLSPIPLQDTTSYDDDNFSTVTPSPCHLEQSSISAEIEIEKLELQVEVQLLRDENTRLQKALSLAEDKIVWMEETMDERHSALEDEALQRLLQDIDQQLREALAASVERVRFLESSLEEAEKQIEEQADMLLRFVRENDQLRQVVQPLRLEAEAGIQTSPAATKTVFSQLMVSLEESESQTSSSLAFPVYSSSLSSPVDATMQTASLLSLCDQGAGSPLGNLPAREIEGHNVSGQIPSYVNVCDSSVDGHVEQREQSVQTMAEIVLQLERSMQTIMRMENVDSAEVHDISEQTMSVAFCNVSVDGYIEQMEQGIQTMAVHAGLLEMNSVGTQTGPSEYEYERLQQEKECTVDVKGGLREDVGEKMTESAVEKEVALRNVAEIALAAECQRLEEVEGSLAAAENARQQLGEQLQGEQRVRGDLERQLAVLEERSARLSKEAELRAVAESLLSKEQERRLEVDQLLKASESGLQAEIQGRKVAEALHEREVGLRKDAESSLKGVEQRLQDEVQGRKIAESSVQSERELRQKAESSVQRLEKKAGIMENVVKETRGRVESEISQQRVLSQQLEAAQRESEKALHRVSELEKALADRHEESGALRRQVEELLAALTAAQQSIEMEAALNKAEKALMSNRLIVDKDRHREEAENITPDIEGCAYRGAADGISVGVQIGDLSAPIEMLEQSMQTTVLPDIAGTPRTAQNGGNHDRLEVVDDPASSSDRVDEADALREVNAKLLESLRQKEGALEHLQINLQESLQDVDSLFEERNKLEIKLGEAQEALCEQSELLRPKPMLGVDVLSPVCVDAVDDCAGNVAQTELDLRRLKEDLLLLRGEQCNLLESTKSLFHSFQDDLSQKLSTDVMMTTSQAKAGENEKGGLDNDSVSADDNQLLVEENEELRTFLLFLVTDMDHQSHELQLVHRKQLLVDAKLKALYSQLGELLHDLQLERGREVVSLG